jgi:hypothetical protein
MGSAQNLFSLLSLFKENALQFDTITIFSYISKSENASKT